LDFHGNGYGADAVRMPFHFLLDCTGKAGAAAEWAERATTAAAN